MNVWLRLHGFEPCSWTYVWENLKDEFENQGDTVYYADSPSNPSDFVEIWWGDPQFWKWSSKKTKLRVAIALSEARSILKSGRESAISNLNSADIIICPSHSATIAFYEAPIDKPIFVVPFGVSDTEFKYIQRNWNAEEFSFLHAGVTQFRKGSWLVPEAFLMAFGDNPKVSLTIATPKVTPMFTKLKYEYGSCTNIRFICSLLLSVSELYESHHVFVSPHLSEGFGLMIPEAMATGMPCLVSRCSAPREYFSSEYGWFIEMSEIYVPIAECLPETNGFWRLPDVNSLAEVMRIAYFNKEQSSAKGKLASEYVIRNMTWKHTVSKIKCLIEEYSNE